MCGSLHSLRLCTPLVRIRSVPRASGPFRPFAPRHRCFHASSAAPFLGLRLPEPSNEPLAGTLSDGSGPPWLFLLQVVVGLPAALWAYKCLMLVLFQRRIIYLPSVPPGTRDESLYDGERTPERDASLSGLEWRQLRVRSTHPTRWLRQPVELAGLEMSWKVGEETRQAGTAVPPKVVVVYLQGNAGTPLMRAPLFRTLLREPTSSDAATTRASTRRPRITLLAVAPRTFWRSTRTVPTEAGILADYRAALAHAYAQHGPSARYVLYGHSLGGAAAVLLLDQLGHPPFAPPTSASNTYTCPPTSSSHAVDSTSALLSASAALPTVSGIVLENPLPSIPYMVRALYPQRWLPYHYLGPLAFDKWDALGRLERLTIPVPKGAASRMRAPRSVWIRSGRDEIIPTGEGDGVRRMYDAWVRATEAVADGVLDLLAKPVFSLYHVFQLSKLDYARLGMSSSKVSDGAHQGLLTSEKNRAAYNGASAAATPRASTAQAMAPVGTGVVGDGSGFHHTGHTVERSV